MNQFAAAFVVITGFTLSCTTVPDTASIELLVVTHISSGDVPIASTLSVDDDGTVVLEYAEGERFLGNASGVQLDQLRHLVDSIDWGAVSEFVDYRQYPHRELAIIQRAEARYYIVVEHTPPDVEPLFRLLDEIGSTQFGERYDQPLCNGTT